MAHIAEEAMSCWANLTTLRGLHFNISIQPCIIAEVLQVWNYAHRFFLYWDLSLLAASQPLMFPWNLMLVMGIPRSLHWKYSRHTNAARYEHAVVYWSCRNIKKGVRRTHNTMELNTLESKLILQSKRKSWIWFNRMTTLYYENTSVTCRRGGLADVEGSSAGVTVPSTCSGRGPPASRACCGFAAVEGPSIGGAVPSACSQRESSRSPTCGGFTDMEGASSTGTTASTISRRKSSASPARTR